MATLDPEYFGVVLRSVLYASDMRASVVHREGQVFVTMPANERILGVNLAQRGSMFTRHRQNGRTATLATGPVLVAGEDRMVVLRTLDRADLHMDKPLIVSVGRDPTAVYVPWREQAWHFGLFHAAVILAWGLGLYFSQRRQTRRFLICTAYPLN